MGQLSRIKYAMNLWKLAIIENIGGKVTQEVSQRIDREDEMKVLLGELMSRRKEECLSSIAIKDQMTRLMRRMFINVADGHQVSFEDMSSMVHTWEGIVQKDKDLLTIQHDIDSTLIDLLTKVSQQLDLVEQEKEWEAERLKRRHLEYNDDLAAG